MELETPIRETLAVLVAYAESQRLVVEFDPDTDDIYDADDKTICINSSNNLREQCWALAHELGHHLIEKNLSRRSQRWGRGYTKNSGGNVNSAVGRTDVVMEEVEAWNRGLDLLTRLKQVINRDSFDSSRSRALRSYFSWALKVPKKMPVVCTDKPMPPHQE